MKNDKTKEILHTAIIAVIIAIVMFSCSKDKEDSEVDGKYYISAKINGTLVEFKEQKTLQGLAGNNGFQHTAYIEGENENQQAITIHFFDLEPIKATSYSGIEVVTGSNLKGVNISYIKDASTVYATDFENPASIGTISTLNNLEVKGTFSGVIRDPLTGESLNVTEGKFSVKRIP